MVRSSSRRVEQVDYLIIGAGIGGMTAHRFLKSNSVALLDPRPERYKVGESIVPRHFVPLELRGVFDEIRRDPAYCMKEGTLFVSDDGVSFFHSFFDADLALHMDRCRLEEIYREHLKPPIRRERVREIDFTRKEVHSDAATYQVARQIIDCSGPAMVVARALGLTEELWPAYASWAYWDVAGTNDARFWDEIAKSDRGCYRFDDQDRELRPFNPPSDLQASGMTMLSHLDKGRWSWQIPLYGGTQLSFGVVSRHGPIDEAEYRELTTRALGSQFDAKARPWDRSSEKNKLHQRNRFAWYSKTFASPDWVLVGDAAFFGDPVYSVGTGLATTQAIRATHLMNHLDWEGGAWKVYEEGTQGIFRQAATAYEHWYAGDLENDDRVAAEVQREMLAGLAFHTDSSVSYTTMWGMCDPTTAKPKSDGPGVELLAMVTEDFAAVSGWSLKGLKAQHHRLRLEWQRQGADTVMMRVEHADRVSRYFRKAGPFALSYEVAQGETVELTPEMDELFSGFAEVLIHHEVEVMQMLKSRDSVQACPDAHP